MAPLGSTAHQALIDRIVRRYDTDPRVRAVASFDLGPGRRALLERLSAEDEGELA